MNAQVLPKYVEKQVRKINKSRTESYFSDILWHLQIWKHVEYKLHFSSITIGSIYRIIEKFLNEFKEFHSLNEHFSSKIKIFYDMFRTEYI